MEKGKVFRYSLPSVGPGANPDVQAVSLQTSSPGGRLPLLTARPVFNLRKHSPDGAIANRCNRHLITAYYLSIDSDGMKGWVGLVGWPTANGLPTFVVTRQLQVERRTGKVRRLETNVLPLCHAANRMVGNIMNTPHRSYRIYNFIITVSPHYVIKENTTTASCNAFC